DSRADLLTQAEPRAPCCVRNGVDPGQQPGLAGLDLQAEILGVDAALGETAGDEPEPRLPGAHEHVAQLLVIAESPDRADAGGNIFAEQSADLVLQPLVAGRQHDQIGGEGVAVAHRRSLREEPGDMGKLPQPDLVSANQIGPADIKVIAAAAGEALELPAGSVVTEIEL